jgi:hypothetical protein
MSIEGCACQIFQGKGTAMIQLSVKTVAFMDPYRQRDDKLEIVMDVEMTVSQMRDAFGQILSEVSDDILHEWLGDFAPDYLLAIEKTEKREECKVTK